MAGAKAATARGAAEAGAAEELGGSGRLATHAQVDPPRHHGVLQEAAGVRSGAAG